MLLRRASVHCVAATLSQIASGLLRKSLDMPDFRTLGVIMERVIAAQVATCPFS
jgi:hypothetical protein